MSGRTPFERDLGGSESALVFAARGLAARGHAVEVYTPCDAPGLVDGVWWRDLRDLDLDAQARDWDVFVSLRFPDLLLRPVRAALRVLWCQDLLDGQPVEAWLAAADRLAFVSEWFRQRTVAAHPNIAPRTAVVENGIDLSLVPHDREEGRTPLLVHLSRPERGLSALLDAWPSIHNRAPGARLAVARYRSFHEPRGSQVEAYCLHMDRRVDLAPGTERLGHLCKPELYRVLSRATLMVYPAEFDETSCIAAIEAQACGCPVVAVRRGALPETLAPGAAVLVDPGPDMRSRFADRTVELLFDPDARRSMSQAGRERARQHGADRIAARWEQVFLDALADRAGHAVPPAGAWAAAWPGVSDALWDSIAARLTGAVRVVGAHSDLPDPGSHLRDRRVQLVDQGGDCRVTQGSPCGCAVSGTTARATCGCGSCVAEICGDVATSLATGTDCRWVDVVATDSGVVECKGLRRSGGAIDGAK